MDASILLNSVILIDHFNGIVTATEYLRSTQGRALVSVVTRAEVLVGFSSRPARKKAEALFGTSVSPSRQTMLMTQRTFVDTTAGRFPTRSRPLLPDATVSRWQRATR